MSIVYSTRKFAIDVGPHQLPDGRTREVTIVRHAPCVVLVPLEADGRVVLIRQYRPALAREIWEVPAGSIDPGEPPEDAARRECEEEIGRAPWRVERLGAWFPTPGYCDEEMIFFKLSDLRPPAPDSPHRPDEDEQIACRSVTLTEARAMVARGEIVDLKTAWALMLV